MNAQGYKEKFGCLEYARRVWAVSSIHGELEPLIALHDRIVTRWRPGDRLVYLGNYLGRGPDIKGVLDELLSFRINRLCQPGMTPEDIVFLRGAQEEICRKILQIQLASDPTAVLDWMVAHDVGNMLEAYGESVEEIRRYLREGILATTKWTNRFREKIRAHPGHNELLVSLRRAAFTEGGELLFVHAGVDPSCSINEQSDSFWWGNSRFNSLDEPFDGFHLVIRGFEKDHSGIRIMPHSVSMDGGCGYGGTLNAICFNLDGSMDDEISIATA
ncbi:MAG: hypothetical protein EP348_07085 [Alphaproteobacteria bacterium]|nr:MAG: hypothetical protein EP348_07085 [Alphaproteobacteria bacterium]